MNNLYGIDHLEQYFDSPWAMLPGTLQSMVNSVNGMDIGTHIADAKAQSDHGDGFLTPEDLIASIITKNDNGVAVVDINGTLTKFGSSLGNEVGMVLMRKGIRALTQDGSVNTIVLHIDSPGGTVAGTADLANAIFEASQVKTVFAFISDLAASGAFWIASQAHRIFANQTAIIGGIGVFTVLKDVSEHAKQLGIKVHVIKSAEFKGLGVPGTPISDGELSEVRRRIMAIHEQFVKAIARGRNISVEEAEKLANGSVEIGQKAVDVGMIDGISTLEETSEMASDHRPEDRRRNFMVAHEETDAQVQAVSRNDFMVTPFADLPIVREPWNPNNNTDGEILDEIKGPDGNNWAAMKQAHLSYAPGEDRGGDPPTINDAYKLKIARRRNGRMTVFFQQLASRVGIINGARGGVDLSQDVKKDAFDHAMRYYDKLDIPQEDRPTFKAEQIETTDDKITHTTTGVRSVGEQGSTANEKETLTMADQDPKPATLKELKAAVKGADAQFYVDQLEKDATVPQAKDAWTDTLAAQNENLQQENKALQDEAKAVQDTPPATPPPGGKAPVGGEESASGEAASGDAQAYVDRIDQLQETGMSRSKAIKKARKEDPAGNRAYILAQNPGRENLVNELLPAID